MIIRSLGLTVALGLFLTTPITAMADPQTLHLQSKDPATWQVDPAGPHGELSFDPQNHSFTFSACELPPETDFALVNHQEGTKRGCILAEGTSDKQGAVSFNGTWNLWQGKFWLVLRKDVRCCGADARLIAWHPRSYLFEERVLNTAD